MIQTKRAAPSQSSPSQINSAKKNNTIGKLDGMLLRFGNGAKFHRFSAERVGDHCLHSTVSSLQSKYGILFARKRIRVPNRFGSETSVCLYWLEGENLERARQIIGIREAA